MTLETRMNFTFEMLNVKGSEKDRVELSHVIN